MEKKKFKGGTRRERKNVKISKYDTMNDCETCVFPISSFQYAMHAIFSMINSILKTLHCVNVVDTDDFIQYFGVVVEFKAKRQVNVSFVVCMSSHNGTTIERKGEQNL